MTDAPDYRAWCELKGEAYVREALATAKIVGSKAAFARNWLAERDRSRTDLSQAEGLEIAKSAREAARAAREASATARTARLIAIAAVIAAVGIPIIAALFE